MKTLTLKAKLIFFSSVIILGCQNSPDNSYKACINEIEKGNYNKALKSCKAACEAGIKDGCLKQAYLLDKYIKDGSGESVKIYEKLCNDGVGDACYNLGNIYEIGRSFAAKDIDKAIFFYKRACVDFKIQQACVKMAEMEVTKTYQTYTEPEKTETKETEHVYYGSKEDIEDTIKNYFKAVEEKRIDEAIDFYVSYRKDKIKRNVLEAIAKDTEYFIVEKAEPVKFYEDKVDVLVRVSQKPVYSEKIQVWEGVWTLQQEEGQWKLLKAPGKRIM